MIIRNHLQNFKVGVRFYQRSFSKWSSLRTTYKIDPTTFCGSRNGTFTQEKPRLSNQYTSDPILRKYIYKYLPKDAIKDIEDDLTRLGGLVSTTVLDKHNDVCMHEPLLQQYDAYGERVDHIIMHPSWKALHDIAAREQLISIPYHNKYREWSRLYQICKLYLFAPSSGLYSCPLAMTDGAASILQYREEERFKNAFSRLIANDPDTFWTSGQWMTEKGGGSDVGEGCETYAIPQDDGTFKLFGYKWFTSAIDANISLTLARIVSPDGTVTKGTKGLSMFYMETRKKDGQLNGLFVEKLKKKLGTKQMPTAELILDGAIAYQLSESGRGIAEISPMLTVTRIHNAVTAVSSMRRVLNLSKDFARKRKAFDKVLYDHPLHMQTLARLEVEQQGGFQLLLKVSRLLGMVENNIATDQKELLLRILTPLLKLYTGKQAVSVSSEGLESFGGLGYLEDTGIPVILRDSQVLSIWEGTTNILSLDVLRSIQKSNGGVLKAYFEDAFNMLTVGNVAELRLKQTQEKLLIALKALKCFSDKAFRSKDPLYLSAAARDYSYSLARVYIGCLLFHDCVGSGDSDDVSASLAFRWSSAQDLTPVLNGDNLQMYDSACFEDDKLLVYDKQ